MKHSETRGTSVHLLNLLIYFNLALNCKLADYLDCTGGALGLKTTAQVLVDIGK